MVAPGYGYGIVAMAALGYGGPQSSQEQWRRYIVIIGGQRSLHYRVKNYPTPQPTRGSDESYKLRSGV